MTRCYSCLVIPSISPPSSGPRLLASHPCLTSRRAHASWPIQVPSDAVRQLIVAQGGRSQGRQNYSEPRPLSVGVSMRRLSNVSVPARNGIVGSRRDLPRCTALVMAKHLCKSVGSSAPVCGASPTAVSGCSLDPVACLSCLYAGTRACGKLPGTQLARAHEGPIPIISIPLAFCYLSCSDVRGMCNSFQLRRLLMLCDYRQ